MATGWRRHGDTSRPDENQAGEFAVDDPSASSVGEPLDMTQVRADDALVDSLSQAGRAAEHDQLDERLAALLLAWKADVNATAADELVDVETATQIVLAAPRPGRRAGRRPLFGPLTAAAAIAIVAFGGVGLAAKDSEPGDSLWGISKVLYADRAQSVEAAFVVRSQLEVASAAMRSGEVGQAEQALAHAQEKLPAVNVKDGKDDLTARTERLQAQLDGMTPVPPPTSRTEPTSPVTSTTDPALTSEQSPSPTSDETTETTIQQPTTTVDSPSTTTQGSRSTNSTGDPSSGPGETEPGDTSNPDGS